MFGVLLQRFIQWIAPHSLRITGAWCSFICFADSCLKEQIIEVSMKLVRCKKVLLADIFNLRRTRVRS